jgi:hypothetical protein
MSASHRYQIRPAAPASHRAPAAGALAAWCCALLLACGDGGSTELGETHTTGGTAGAMGGAAAGAGGAPGPGGSGATAGSGGSAGGSAGAGASAGGTAGSGASGASGAGAAGGTGGSGAGGAPALACPYLVLAGGPSGVAPSAARNERRPRLVLADQLGGPGAVALVLATEPVESPIAPPVAVEHVAFDPWGVFPSSLGAASIAVGLGGQSYVAGPAVGKGFSLLYTSQPQVPSLPDSALFLDEQIAPGAAADATAVGDPTDTPEAVTSNGVGACIASAPSPVGQHHGMGFRIFEDTGSSTYSQTACATSEVMADAIPWGTGYLLAYTTSRLCCLCDDGVDGPPSMLVLAAAHVLQSPEVVTTLDLEAPATFSYLRLIASPGGGGWLITKISGGVVDGPFVAQRVTPEGAVAPGFEVVPSDATSQPPAVAALGDGLGVAWLKTSGKIPTVLLRAFDAEGNGSGTSGFETNPISIETALGSPDGQHLLVGWSAFDPTANATRVQVARFDCAPLPP